MMGKSAQWLKFAVVSAMFCLTASLWGCGGGNDASTALLSSEVKATGESGDETKGAGSSDSAPFVAGELLVQTRAGVLKEKFDQVLGSLNASTLEEIGRIRVKRIKVPAQALERILAVLARNPHVKFVEKNYLVKADLTPTDVHYTVQWHLPKISAPPAWDISTGSSGISIAIADTGVDPSHPDLSAKLLTGYNFVKGNTDTRDVHGHGTLVAGSAAAISNNGVGVAGVAWSNPIVPLVVADSSGYATYSTLANAITYAADRGIRIINMSFGGPSSSFTLQNAIDYAWNKGSIVFASAGNNGNSTPQYPAACNHAVAVTATNSSDALASFSTYGTWVTVSAPGQSIATTKMGGSYYYASGTSFSAPITAGLGALILSVNPGLTAAQVVDIIKQNGDDLGAAGFDQYFGYGRINAYKSLNAARSSSTQEDTTAPVASITSPTHGATVSGTVPVTVSASDNMGVERVELYVDGALLAIDTTAPYSFSWDTTATGAGTRYLHAVAYDAAGNNGQSAQISVTVETLSDTTAPLSSITSPTHGATVSGTVPVTVSASDNVGVTRVELYVNGALLATDTTAPYSFSWDTVKTGTGTRYLHAVAYDAAGNAGQSSQITVTVSGDTIAPKVKITKPSNGTTVRNTVVITATATDNVAVMRMELYLDGALIQTSASGSISSSWNSNTASTGRHTITAKAFDAVGNTGSASVYVYR